MGKNEHDPLKEREAAMEHYRGISRPLDAREACEAQESAEALLIDAWAHKLRAAGCPAKDAPTYAAAVVAVLKARDKACVAGVMEEAEGVREENLLAKAEALEALRVMAIKLVQAPKPRFSAGCFLLAAGIDYDGVRSERDWAERQGASHTQANNEVRDWQQTLKLPKTSRQKSEAARNSYKTNGRIRDDE